MELNAANEGGEETEGVARRNRETGNTYMDAQISAHVLGRTCTTNAPCIYMRTYKYAYTGHPFEHPVILGQFLRRSHGGGITWIRADFRE